MRVLQTARTLCASAAAAAVLLSGGPAAAVDPGPAPHGEMTPDPSSQAHGNGPAEPEKASPDYAEADWSAASGANYTVADRPHDHRIKYVVIHVMQGTYEGTKSWFKNPDSQVTTHYIMRAKDGHVTQMVREKNIAWHAGNWEVNTESIGIEHEGWVDQRKWFTDTVYRSSARLVRDICDRYGIPKDRDHIIGHSEVPGADHTDPGRYWDWDRYMSYVRDDDDDDHEGLVVDDGDAERVTASGSWTAADMDGQYGDGVHTASPVLHSDPLWYDADLADAGAYRVYVRYPADSGNNDRTPYIVHTTDGNRTVYVDQRTGGSQWRSIGVFDLDAGDGPVVAVSRWTGGTGTIVADAVRLVRQ